MSALIKTLTRISKTSARAITNKGMSSGSCGSKPTGKKPNYSKRVIRFKQLQQHFQRDDGKPIFLKGGTADRVLFLSTVGLGILGLILDLKYYASYIFDDK